MRHFLYIFLLLFSPISGAVAANHYFLSPATSTGINPVWTLGEEQVVSWKTSLEIFNVSIWQQSLVEEGASSQGNVYSKIHSYDDVSNFTWVVQTYDFDFDYSNVYFFWINPDTSTGFVSAYFNITKPTSTSTSTSTISNTPTIPPTSIATTVSLRTASSSFSSTSAAAQFSSSPGITSTGKIALGVGIGVDVPVLGTLASLLWLKARQSNSNRHSQMAAMSAITVPPIAMPPSELMMHQRQPYPSSVPKAVHNIDSREYYPELPSQQHQ